MAPTALFDIRVVLVFLAMLTVLVFAHELGHYLFARLFGMGVEEFAIGFGRPVVGTYYRRRYRIPLAPDQADAWERGELDVPMPEGLPKALESCSEPGELVRDPAGAYLAETTNFTVRALPLGGFVRIRGMTPEAQGKETQVPGGFYSKPPWQRLIVLFAGPLFSVLAGLIILTAHEMIAGEQVMSHHPVLAEVMPDGAGYKGGLREGDRIVSIDKQPISDFYEVVKQVRSHVGKPVSFVVDRAGKMMNLQVTPMLEDRPSLVLGPNLQPSGEMARQAKLQVRPELVSVRLGFVDATRAAVEVPIVTVASLFEGVIHPSQLKEQVGGPVSIVRVTAEATHDGVAQVFRIAGILSVSLGIFNLLPIFPLDGGQMLVSFAEMLRRGRRLSMKAQGIVATMGFSAILMLVVSVLYIDLQRLHNDNAKPPAPSTSK